MAASIAVSVYGANGNDFKNPQGLTMGFPSANTVIRALNPAVVYGGVLCNTVMQLLPTGPSTVQPQFYTPAVTATVITAGA